MRIYRILQPLTDHLIYLSRNFPSAVLSGPNSNHGAIPAIVRPTDSICVTNSLLLAFADEERPTGIFFLNWSLLKLLKPDLLSLIAYVPNILYHSGKHFALVQQKLP